MTEFKPDWMCNGECPAKEALKEQLKAQADLASPEQSAGEVVSPDVNAAINVMGLYFPDWKTCKDVRSTAIRTLIQAVTRSSQPTVTVRQIYDEFGAVEGSKVLAFCQRHALLGGNTGEK